MTFIQSLALYPLMALLSLLFTVFAMLAVNWWVPLLADDKGNLPAWLKWFQPFDSSLDEAWRGGYLDPSWGISPFKRYLARVYWLYRNPAYGFDYWALGVPFEASQWRVIRYIDTPQLVLFVAIGNSFNVYYHGRLGMLKLGWKAWNRWDGKGWNAPNWQRYARLPLCFTVNPFKRRLVTDKHKPK